MLILGITGGVATGKSTVTGLFSALGAPHASADSIAHELLAPGSPVAQAVLAAFPDCKSNASGVPVIDRAALARIVFADPEARRRLESLTHPPIVERLSVLIDVWRKAPGKAAVVEIPLLFESGLRGMVDSAVVVVCSRSTQIARLRERRSLTDAEAAAWIDAQWPLDKKKALADYLIDTDSGLSETEAHVRAIWNSL